MKPTPVNPSRTASVLRRVVQHPACPRCDTSLRPGNYRLLRSNQDADGMRWQSIRCASCGRLAAIYETIKK